MGGGNFGQVSDLRTRHGKLYGRKGCHKDVREAFHCLRITLGYTSEAEAAETLQDKPGLHRDPPGRVKDTPYGFTDLVDTREWGLRIKIFLADVSL